MRRRTVDVSVCQHTPLKMDQFRDSQPVKLPKLRSEAIRRPRGENQPSGGVEDGVESVHMVTGNVSQYRIIVVNLADH